MNQTRWLKAMEIRPGDKHVVHHANVLVDRMQSARLQSPLRAQVSPEWKSESNRKPSIPTVTFFSGSREPCRTQNQTAWRYDSMQARTWCSNIRLQPSGKPQWIQPSLGLYFTDRPATLYPMLVQLENDRKIDIPAGAKDFIVTDEFTVPEDVELPGDLPACALCGTRSSGFCNLSGWNTKSLIHIPEWNLNWQAVYRYATPVELAARTVVSMRYSYDNTDGNPAQPE